VALVAPAFGIGEGAAGFGKGDRDCLAGRRRNVIGRREQFQHDDAGVL
jgi:hypothetical protein